MQGGPAGHGADLGVGEGGEVDLGEPGAAVPGEQERVTFHAFEKAEKDRLGEPGAGGAAVGALEDEVVGVDARAVVGEPGGDEDGPLVAQRVAPDPGDLAVRVEGAEQGVVRVRLGGVDPAGARVEGVGGELVVAAEDGGGAALGGRSPAYRSRPSRKARRRLVAVRLAWPDQVTSVSPA